MASLFPTSSKDVLARITTFPLPVSKASLTPSYPYIIPPVGKSGAFMMFH